MSDYTDFGMENNQRSSGSDNGKKILWVIIIFGLIYFGLNYLEAPQSQSLVSGDFAEQEQDTYSRGEEVQLALLDNDEDGVNNRDDMCPNTMDGESVDNNGCSKDQNYDLNLILNECGSNSYGFPDYDGTEKEGKKCNDFVPSARDLECIANPPDNYDGEINGVSSSPQILCCYTDGTCYW